MKNININSDDNINPVELLAKVEKLVPDSYFILISVQKKEDKNGKVEGLSVTNLVQESAIFFIERWLECNNPKEKSKQ